MLIFSQIDQSRWQSPAILTMGKDQKRGFPRFYRTVQVNAHDRAFTQKYVATHCILAIFLDDNEMLRDRFMGKLGEEPKVSGGFRSVVGTGAWQKLKETAAV